MRTEYRVVGDDALFVVLDLPERYLEAARALYFEQVGDGMARRFPATSRHLERAYEGFARHVEDMLLQHSSISCLRSTSVEAGPTEPRSSEEP